MGTVLQLPSIKPRSTTRRRGLRKLSPDLISKARDETATQVTRIGLTFLGTAAFCLLSLLSPDSALLGGSEKINVPLGIGPVSFVGFMLLGPAVLIALRVYLQIYVEHSMRLDRLVCSLSTVRAPTLVPLDNRLIRLVSVVIFYGLLPVAILLFAWKAAAFSAWGLGLFSVAVAVIVSHVILPFSRLSWRPKALLSVSAAIIAGGAMLGLGPPYRPFLLSRANLADQWLHGEQLREANLESANLSRADLSSANLRSADLRSANLRGANLSHADLRSANLSGAELFDADLSGAQLLRANVGGVDLRGARLSGAGLSGANLPGANLNSADLSGAQLFFADLRDANLSNAKLSNANLSGAKLNSASLRDANLSNANLRGANLDSANLVRADLKEADLSGAKLSGANLTSADLRSANLYSADLSNADLGRANLVSADLSNANLVRANLVSADLSDAKNLTQMQLDKACGEPATTKLRLWGPPQTGDLTIKAC
jgi:uncharacterized protein YjbI with pentapeptide repeats